VGRRQAGVEKLGALRVLLASNNKLSAWAEVERLAALPCLEELLLAGNPLQCDFRDRNTLAEYRLEARPLACISQRILFMYSVGSTCVDFSTANAVGAAPSATSKLASPQNRKQLTILSVAWASNGLLGR